MNEVNLTGIQNAINKYTSQDTKMVLRRDAENFLNTNDQKTPEKSSNSENLALEQQETQKGTIIDTYA